MNGQVRLSFSTINNCLQPHNSHNWINKMSGIKPEVTIYMTGGQLGHRLIQDHISGRKIIPGVEIKPTFPIVEEKPFDERCKFSIKIGEYEIIGFKDGMNPEERSMAEIKLSGNPWSMLKFQKSPQRKIYALSDPKLLVAYLITGGIDPETWVKTEGKEYKPLKTYKVQVTDKDRQDGTDWIMAGIKLFEIGDFTGGLDENDRCTDRWCSWGKNCQFKQI